MAEPCRLHYEIRGGKSPRPPLLFLHGFMGSLHDWSEAAAALEQFRCILPDLPGHGRTAVCAFSDHYSMAGAAAALIRMLDEVGVGGFTPVGYSMGGRLALYLAVHYPDRCAGVVMESASPGLATATERRQRQLWDESMALELERGDLAGFLGMWYAQPLFDTLTRNPERFRPVLERRQQNDPFELARSMRGMGAGAQPSLWSELEKMDLPLLAICGERDGKYRKTMGDMVRLCKRGRLGVIPGAGHNVHCEAPEPYVRVLESFLNEEG